MLHFVLSSMMIFLGLTQTAAIKAAENAVPEDIRKELEFFVGAWDVESEMNGEKATAKYTARWTPGQDSLVLNFESDVLTATGIAGWDPTTKEIVETWYSPSIGRLTQRFKPISADVWEGSSREQQPDGTVTEGTSRLEKTDKDTFKYTRSTGDRKWTNVNHRIQPESRPTNADRLQPFEFFIGKWKSTKNDGSESTWVFNWGHKKNSINNTVVSRGPDGVITLCNAGILIWEAGNRQFVNVCVNADGNRVDFVWEKKADREWQTWLRGIDGTASVEIIDDNGWEIKWDGGSHIYERQN